MRGLKFPALGCLIAAGLSMPARPANAAGLLQEVRLGVLAHDVQFGGGPQEGGADINGEALFASPIPADAFAATTPAWLRTLLRPRPMVGFQANTAGLTSQGYAGLTFTLPLAPRLFLDAGEALSMNDGHVDQRDGPYKRLGSNALFRTDFDLGFRITPRWTAYWEIDHESNAGLARRNEGLTQTGIRIGFDF